MSETIISAEIVPLPNQSSQAAIGLQRRGFRILHIGPTISVQGSQSLWVSTFQVAFESQKKSVMAEVERAEVTYQKALTDTVHIPAELQNLISEVMFVEPPELFI